MTTATYSYREYAAAGRQLASGERLPPFGSEWRRARKGILRFMPDAIQFEDWGIPYDSIEQGEVISPADIPFVDRLYSVLRLSTVDFLYEFRIDSFGFARSDFPFVVERIRVPIVQARPKIVIYVAVFALIVGLVLGGKFLGW